MTAMALRYIIRSIMILAAEGVMLWCLEAVERGKRPKPPARSGLKFRKERSGLFCNTPARPEQQRESRFSVCRRWPPPRSDRPVVHLTGSEEARIAKTGDF